jgi:recombination protein RecR
VAKSYSPLLEQLIEALQCLPGVGMRSAQRMAFHLLNKDREGASVLGKALEESRKILHCGRCRMLTEEAECALCASSQRDGAQICVVETPADLVAIEHSGAYRGKYFVLMGHLSPIDGIGPKELGLEMLEERFKEGKVGEAILATAATVEGEATARLVAVLAHRHGIRASRIAHGVPVGGELEFIDGGTLSRAIAGRREIEKLSIEEIEA